MSSEAVFAAMARDPLLCYRFGMKELQPIIKELGLRRAENKTDACEKLVRYQNGESLCEDFQYDKLLTIIHELYDIPVKELKKYLVMDLCMMFNQAKKPTKSSRGSKSPRGTRSPKRSTSPKRASKSPQRSKSPNRSTSPRGSRSPKRSTSPKRTKSPRGSRSPKRSKSPKRTKSPKRSTSPKGTRSPKRSKSPKRSTSPKRTETSLDLPLRERTPGRPATPTSPKERTPGRLITPKGTPTLPKERTPERIIEEEKVPLDKGIGEGKDRKPIPKRRKKRTPPPPPDPKVCQALLDEMQEEASIYDEYDLDTDPNFKSYVAQRCGTEPVLFSDLLLHSVKAADDGNCFFDSIKTLLDISEDLKTFRRQLGSRFTLDDYYKINNGMEALSHVEYLLPTAEFIMSGEEVKAAIGMLDPEEKHEAQKIIDKQYREARKKLEKFKEWATDWMVGFVGRALNVNIVVYENRARRYQMFTELVHYRPYVFVYNFSQRHFEPMVANDGQKVFSEEQIEGGLREITALS